MRFLKNIFYFLIFAFILTSYLIFSFLFYKPKVVFFNVGQGSAVGIFNKKTSLLYDVGPGEVLGRELHRFLPFGRKTIDGILISHYDKDHYGGLFKILKNYRVKFLILNEILPERSFEKQIKLISPTTKIIKATKGTTIKTPFEFLVILNDAQGKKEDNEKSLVVKLTQFYSGILNQKVDFLLMGDLPNSVRDIFDFNLKSDILLVPHHGSRYNISEELIQKVSPRLAVIQVGLNSYGHPHQETIDLLKKFNINFWRTDINGELILP